MEQNEGKDSHQPISCLRVWLNEYLESKMKFAKVELDIRAGIEACV